MSRHMLHHSLSSRAARAGPLRRSGKAPTRCPPACAVSGEFLSRTTGMTLEDANAALVTSPALSRADEQLVQKNVELLRSTYKPHAVSRLLQKRPALLGLGLHDWIQFLTGYGVDSQAIWRLLRHRPELFTSTAGGNTPYNAGTAIVFLKAYGWTDEEVVARILPCYPEVLAAKPEQLQFVVEFLRSRSFDEEAIRRLIRTFPQLLVPSFHTSLFELVDRIRASAHNKYVMSGSYHV